MFQLKFCAATAAAATVALVDATTALTTAGPSGQSPPAVPRAPGTSPAVLLVPGASPGAANSSGVPPRPRFTSTGKLVSDMDFSVYEDPMYFTLLHVNGIFCTLPTIFAVYFILFKSPTYFGNYKWFLLNIAVSSFLFDFHMSVLWIPAPLFPALVMCARGVIRRFGWFYGGYMGFLAFPALLGACSMSIVWALLYRWALVTNRERAFLTPFAIFCMGFVQIFFMTPTLALYFISVRDHDAVVAHVVEKFPRIVDSIGGGHDACAITSFEASKVALYFMISCVTQFSLPLFMVVFILYLSYKALDKHAKEMTEKTIRMHRQLLKSLIMQMTIPFGSLFVPYSLLALLVVLEAERASTFYKAAILIGTLHTFLNSSVMLFSIEAFRVEIFRYFFRFTSRLGLPVSERKENGSTSVTRLPLGSATKHTVQGASQR